MRGTNGHGHKSREEPVVAVMGARPLASRGSGEMKRLSVPAQSTGTVRVGWQVTASRGTPRRTGRLRPYCVRASPRTSPATEPTCARDRGRRPPLRVLVAARGRIAFGGTGRCNESTAGGGSGAESPSETPLARGPLLFQTVLPVRQEASPPFSTFPRRSGPRANDSAPQPFTRRCARITTSVAKHRFVPRSWIFHSLIAGPLHNRSREIGLAAI